MNIFLCVQSVFMHLHPCSFRWYSLSTFCSTIDAFSLPVSEIPSDCCCGPPGGALQCFLLLYHLIWLKHKADNSLVCVKVSIKMASDSSQLSYYPLSLSRKKPKPRRARFKRCQLLCDSSRLRNIRGERSPCFGMSAGRLWLPDRLPWDVKTSLSSTLCEYGKHTPFHLKLCGSTEFPWSHCDRPNYTAYLRGMYFFSQLQYVSNLNVEKPAA